MALNRNKVQVNSTSEHISQFPFQNGIREVKDDVYGKRQTAKMKLLPSVFSCLYSRIKIFVFAVNSKRHLYFCVIYFRITRKAENRKSEVIFAVCRLP